MDIETKIHRESKLRLTNDEFYQAIRNYLKNNDIEDWDQYIEINVVHTNDERGDELAIKLINMNIENNLIDKLCNQK